MPIKPFRQITPALLPPALTDQVVGVRGGHDDVLWTFNQIAEVIGGGGGLALMIGTTPILGGAANKFLYDNGGTLEEGTFGSGLTFAGGVLTATATGGGRTLLTADANYYVSTSGNDSNPGTITQPWLTLQHAMDVIAATIDIGGFTVTVNIGAGTFAGVGLKATVGGGIVYFLAAGSSSTTIINGPNDGNYNGGECFSVYVPVYSQFQIKGMTLAVVNNFAIDAFCAVRFITIDDITIDFTNIGSLGIVYLIDATGAFVQTLGDTTYVGTGSVADIFFIENNATFLQQDSIRLACTLTITDAFAYADSGGVISCIGAITHISGSVTGQRFKLINDGTAVSLGLPLGLTYFPGTVEGFCDSSSVYDGQPGTDLTYPQPTTALRAVLTANTSFFVSATGSDSNDGSSGSPWLTPQHAMAFIATNIDIAGFVITVNVGAGTFVGIDILDCVGGGIVQWEGAGRTSTTLTKAAVGDHCFGIEASTSTIFGLDNVTLDDQSVATNALIETLSGSTILIIGNAPKVIRNVGPSHHLDVGMIGHGSDLGINGSGGYLIIDAVGTGAGITISGSFGRGVVSLDVLTNVQDFGAWVLSGTPTFSSFLAVFDEALYVALGTFSGSGTGQRFFAISGGVISNGGSPPGTLGPNFFPGTTEGYCDSSSFYDGFPGTNLTYPQPTTALKTLLTASATFYVATAGSDSNDGSIASPFATIQHAVTFVETTFRCGVGAVITIQVADGTYNESVILGPVESLDDGSQPILQGNTSILTNVVITQLEVGNFKQASWQVQGFYVKNGLQVFSYSYILADLLQFDVVSGGDVFTAGQGALLQFNNITISNPLAVNGSSLFFLYALSNVLGTPLRLTILDDVTFTDAVIVSQQSQFQADFGASAGAITGAAHLHGPWLDLKIGSAASYAFYAASSPPGSTTIGKVDSSSSYNGQPGTNLDYPQSTTILRTVIAGDTDLYVNNSTGSDSNDGSLAHPWLTLQHAWDTVGSTFDLSIHDLTIHLGASATPYTLNADQGFVGGHRLIIDGGNAATIRDCVLSVSIDFNFGNPNVIFRNLTCDTATPGGTPFYDGGFGSVLLNNVTLDTTPTGGAGGTHVLCDAGGSGSVLNLSGITVKGNAGNCLAVTQMGFLINLGGPFTLVGTPAFSSSFLLVDGNSIYQDENQGFTGSATGKRFQVSNNSTISIFGNNDASETYFPGNAAGFCDSSSSYSGRPGTNLTYPQTTTIIRTVLTANTTFHVATTGNDSNDGSAGSPWATVDHANVFIAANIDIAGFTVTVSIGAGTFAGVGTKAYSGGGLVQFNGAGPGSTILTDWPGGLGCFVVNGVSTATIAVDLMTMTPSDSGFAAISVGAVGTLVLGQAFTFTGSNLAFGGGVTNAQALVFCQLPTNIFVALGTFTVTGAWSTGWQIFNNTTVGDFGSWVMSGTPSFSAQAFAYILSGAQYVSEGATYTGAATGTRFSMSGGGGALGGGVGALGPNFFPGSVSGVVDATSSYDGFPGPLPGINTQVTGYTFAIADAFARVEYNGTGAAVFTVPGNGTVGFEIGTKITMTQIGTGNLSGSAGGGVTVHNVGAVGGQWRSAMLYKRGTDEWVQTNV